MCAYNIPTSNARVKVRFGNIANFIPQEADIDFSFAAYISSTGDYKLPTSNVSYHQQAECFHKKPLWINRNNYLADVGINPVELPIYTDSNAEVEMAKRTFQAIPRGRQLALDAASASAASAKDTDYFMPPGKSNYALYPTYGGPRWQYVYLPTTDAFGNSTQTQFLNQYNASPNISWAIRQSFPQSYNQPFWVDIHKPASFNTDREDVNKPVTCKWDPVAGPYFMIVVGGSAGCPYKFQSPYGYIGNSYSIVFPVNSNPFIIDNNLWTTYAQFVSDESPNYGGDGSDTSAPLDPAAYAYLFSPVEAQAFAQMNTLQKITFIVEKSKITTQSDQSWIIPNEAIRVRISVMIIADKIYITNSLSGKVWFFPDNQVIMKMFPGMQEFNTSYLNNEDRYGPNGFKIKNIPVEIHGKGMSASINFMPMEFAMGGYIETPPFYYSENQMLLPFGYFMQSSSSSVRDDPDDDDYVFHVPPIVKDKCKGRGYDVSQFDNLTTMLLPAKSVKAARRYSPDPTQWDYLTSNSYSMGTGIPGGPVIKQNPTAVSRMTKVRVYEIYFADLKPVNGDGSSSAYYTPFAYRIKLKGITKSISATGYEKDISTNLQEISYSYKVDATCVQKNVRLTFLMPKNTDNDGDYAITARTIAQDNVWSWERLTKTPCMVAVWLGVRGHTDTIIPDTARLGNSRTGAGGAFFLGISQGGDMNMSREKDTATLDCWDYVSLLEEMFYVNAPYFDGMSIPYAVSTVLEKAGFPATMGTKDQQFVGTASPDGKLIVSNKDMYDFTAPTSNNFLKPILHPQPNTKLLDVIKQLANIFQLLFYYSEAHNKFVLHHWDLGSVNTNLLSILPRRLWPTNAFFSYVSADNTFKMFPQADSEWYNVIIDKKTIKCKPKSWQNIFAIHTVDRKSLTPIIVMDGIPSSVDITKGGLTDNFVGYMRGYMKRQSSFGGVAEAKSFLRQYITANSQPMMVCTIKTFGRRGLKPYDMIVIDNNCYRITNISGSLSAQPNPVWMMDITAESTGERNSDVDNSRLDGF